VRTELLLVLRADEFSLPTSSIQAAGKRYTHGFQGGGKREDCLTGGGLTVVNMGGLGSDLICRPFVGRGGVYILTGC